MEGFKSAVVHDCMGEKLKTLELKFWQHFNNQNVLFQF